MTSYDQIPTLAPSPGTLPLKAGDTYRRVLTSCGYIDQYLHACPKIMFISAADATEHYILCSGADMSADREAAAARLGSGSDCGYTRKSKLCPSRILPWRRGVVPPSLHSCPQPVGGKRQRGNEALGTARKGHGPSRAGYELGVPAAPPRIGSSLRRT